MAKRPWTDDRLHFGPAVTESDIKGLSRALYLSFGGDEDTAAGFVGRHRDHLFVLREKGGADTPEGVLAGVTLLPMGHHLGGRLVPQLGVRAVAVPPEYRGAGIATALMRAVVAHARTAGYPLTSLYASTRALYRKVGYEIAGERMVQKFDPRRIACDAGGTLSQRALTAADRDACRALYDEAAPVWGGWLHRNDEYWLDIFESRKLKPQGVVIEGDDARLEGYVVYALTRSPEPRPEFTYDVVVIDACARSARGWQSVASVFAGFGTLAEIVAFASSPVHPLRLIMSEAADASFSRQLWMTRVVDLPAAMSARGFAPAVRAEATLQIEDGLISEQSGVWRVSVEEGRGHAERVDEPAASAARIDAGRLGPLFTGYLSAEQMAQIGWIDGPPDTLASLSAIFAGAVPGMCDMF